MGRYVRERNLQTKKYYIYDTKEKKKISKEWKYILEYGLMEGKSKYYIVIDDDSKNHIFYWDGKRNIQVTKKGYNYIYQEGLVEGKSDYYIIKNDDRKEYLFYWDGKKSIQITNKGWKYVFHVGLVDYQSSYYITKDEKDYFYLFDKNNNLYLKFKQVFLFDVFSELIKDTPLKEELLYEIMKWGIYKK